MHVRVVVNTHSITQARARREDAMRSMQADIEALEEQVEIQNLDHER